MIEKQEQLQIKQRLLTVSFGLLAFVFIMFSFVACSDDNDDPLPSPTASFTYEVDEENPLTIHFTNTSENYEESSWDFGDGETSNEENPSHTYNQQGEFNVILVVSGEGGTATDEQTVEALEPIEGERITGGDMQDPDAWEISIGGFDLLPEYEFTDGVLRFDTPDEEEPEASISVWQEITVQSGVDYQLSADVTGGGMVQAWLEIGIGPEPPVEGEDYSTDFKIMGINYWAGCGEDEFDGDIVDVVCDYGEEYEIDEEAGTFQFNQSGTHYFVIKAGTWQGTLGPDGVTITNVSLQQVD